jgi:hypothetical protein
MEYHLYYTLFGIEHHVSKEKIQRPVSMHDIHAALIFTNRRWGRLLCFNNNSNSKERRPTALRREKRESALGQRIRISVIK